METPPFPMTRDVVASPHQKTSVRAATVALCTLVVVASAFVFVPGTSDMEIWTRWMQMARDEGPVRGFDAIKADYPPASLAVLWLLEELVGATQCDRKYAIKCLLWLSLTVTCYTAWWFARRRAPQRTALWLSAVIGWTLLLDSVALGYLDILVAPPLLSAIWLYLDDKRPKLAALLFWLSALLKWQPLLLAPFVGALLINRYRQGQKADLRWFGLVGGALLCACLGVYGTAFLRAFQRATNHNYLSGNAVNLGWIVGHGLHVFAPESFRPLDQGLSTYIVTKAWQINAVPRLLFVLFYCWAWLRALNRHVTSEHWQRLALVGYLAYFTFNVGVHENHLSVAAVLAALAACKGALRLREYVCIAVALNTNLVLFYGVTGHLVRHARVIGGIDSALAAACVWVMWVVFWSVRELWAAEGKAPENAR